MATVASKLAVAKDLPSGDQLQLRMVLVCASSRVALQTQSLLPGCFLVHSLTVLSPLQLASVSPASPCHDDQQISSEHRDQVNALGTASI